MTTIREMLDAAEKIRRTQESIERIARSPMLEAVRQAQANSALFQQSAIAAAEHLALRQESIALQAGAHLHIAEEAARGFDRFVGSPTRPNGSCHTSGRLSA